MYKKIYRGVKTQNQSKGPSWGTDEQVMVYPWFEVVDGIN